MRITNITINTKVRTYLQSLWKEKKLFPFYSSGRSRGNARAIKKSSRERVRQVPMF